MRKDTSSAPYLVHILNFHQVPLPDSIDTVAAVDNLENESLSRMADNALSSERRQQDDPTRISDATMTNRE